MTLHPCFQPAFPLLPIPTPLHSKYGRNSALGLVQQHSKYGRNSALGLVQQHNRYGRNSALGLVQQHSKYGWNSALGLVQQHNRYGRNSALGLVQQHSKYGRNSIILIILADTVTLTGIPAMMHHITIEDIVRTNIMIMIIITLWWRYTPYNFRTRFL